MAEDPGKREPEPDPKSAAEKPVINKESAPRKSPIEEVEQILGDADEEDRFQRTDN